MGTHTVNLSDTAYELLRNAKINGESFSEVITRVLGKRSVLDLVGILSPQRAKEWKTNAREMGRRGRGGLDQVAARLRKPSTPGE